MPLATLADNDSAPISTANPLPVSFPSSQPVTVPIPAEIVAHSVIASAAGNTAIWTPSAGKKFRLRAVAWTFGLLNATQPLILLNDAGTIITYLTAIPSTGGTLQSGYMLLPDRGILSSAANNVLNVNINAASAGIAITVFGTEE